MFHVLYVQYSIYYTYVQLKSIEMRSFLATKCTLYISFSLHVLIMYLHVYVLIILNNEGKV